MTRLTRPDVISRILRPTLLFRQDLFKLAEDMGMTDKMRSIALGQGQGAIAAAMIEKVHGRRSSAGVALFGQKHVFV